MNKNFPRKSFSNVFSPNMFHDIMLSCYRWVAQTTTDKMDSVGQKGHTRRIRNLEYMFLSTIPSFCKILLIYYFGNITNRFDFFQKWVKLIETKSKFRLDINSIYNQVLKSFECLRRSCGDKKYRRSDGSKTFTQGYIVPRLIELFL